jgi:hypothetical protein
MLIESGEDFPDPAAALFLAEGVAAGGFLGDPGRGQVIGRSGDLGGRGEPFPVFPGDRSPQAFENLFPFARGREGFLFIHPMLLQDEFNRPVQEGNAFIVYMGPPDDLFPKIPGLPPAPAEARFDKGPGFNQSDLDPLQTKDQITLHGTLPPVFGIQAETVCPRGETSSVRGRPEISPHPLFIKLILSHDWFAGHRRFYSVQLSHGLNSKFETRNPKQSLNSNFLMTETIFLRLCRLEFWSFEI